MIAGKDEYTWLTFSPASGVGYYLHRAATYRFDLLTSDIRLVAGGSAERAWSAMGQMAVDLAFESRQELLAAAQNEFLREKKHTFYSLLLHDDETLVDRLQLLHLLNRDGFRSIRFSQQFRSYLAETVPAENHWRLLNEATAARCATVERCLVAELGDLALDPGSIAALAERVRAEPMAVSDLISAITRVLVGRSGRAQPWITDAMVAFADSLGRAAAQYTVAAIGPFERALATLFPGRRVLSADAKRWQAELNDAIARQSPTGAMNACRAYRQESLQPRADIMLAGRMVAAHVREWRIQWSHIARGGFQLRLVPDQPEQEGSSEWLREVLYSRGGQTLLGTRANMPYALYVRQIPWGRRPSGADSRTAALAFWLAYQVEPDLVVPRLSPRRVAVDWTTALVSYLRAEPHMTPSYDIVNFVSLMLLELGLPSGLGSELGWTALSVADHVISRDRYRGQYSVFPAQVLANNMLVWAAQVDDHALARAALRVLGRVRKKPWPFSPFLRVII